MSQQWMSIIEYSRNFNVSDMTVRRRIKNGKLQASLKEGKYFIPVESNHQPLVEDENSPLGWDNPNQANKSGKPNVNIPLQARQPATSGSGLLNGAEMGQGTQTQMFHSRLSGDHPKMGMDGVPRGMPKPSSMDSSLKQQGLNERSYALPGRPQPKRIASPTPMIDSYLSEQFKEDQLLQVSSCDLLEFANKALEQAEGKCRVLRSECELKLAAIETELVLRDKKIEELNQQIEDLQLLIKVIENKV